MQRISQEEAQKVLAKELSKRRTGNYNDLKFKYDIFIYSYDLKNKKK